MVVKRIGILLGLTMAAMLSPAVLTQELSTTELRRQPVTRFDGAVTIKNADGSSRELKVKIPVVIRMKGNNEEKGKAMLKESGLNFETADNMAEAAQKVVAAVGEKR
jgi:GH35 family endo-1,4-beta-xylanase